MFGRLSKKLILELLGLPRYHANVHVAQLTPGLSDLSTVTEIPPPPEPQRPACCTASILMSYVSRLSNMGAVLTTAEHDVFLSTTYAVRYPGARPVYAGGGFTD